MPNAPCPFLNLIYCFFKSLLLPALIFKSTSFANISQKICKTIVPKIKRKE
ncbi:hypothetical protein H6G33_26455 [Calothrix sp. FACHB-1219]|uniref:hypothetical protein n=1 Tax=unclassified Calothrix TaxID=2619626 RepID=UPI00168318C9|nr:MULTISPECIES: hypothetical protein [unclassified Calothrix]MBD2204244.1 hypothetical protein [Calothrix sp. FACHB-168]MBD2220550.1 hypothetical protein [Calothrix sp. FACHB-1219]